MTIEAKQTKRGAELDAVIREKLVALGYAPMRELVSLALASPNDSGRE